MDTIETGLVAQTDKLKVYEWLSGFTVEYKGESKWIGDMVGSYEYKNGVPVMVGSAAFYRMLQTDLERNSAEWIEAYFGE